MLRKLTLYLGLAILPLAVGCYDAGSKENCLGLSCPTGFQWPDGGEVRVQYFRLPGGGEVRRLMAFFIESQVPDRYEAPAPGRCFREPAHPGDDREYIDAGESVTFNLNDVDQTVERATADGDQLVTDFFGRTHKLAYLGETTGEVGEEFFNSFLSLETSGDLPFGDKLEGIYMPPKLEVLTPEGPGVVQLKPGEDLVVEWEEVEAPNPNVVTGGSIVFSSPGQDDTTCVTANSGRFVVPGEVIANLPGDSGVMNVGTVSNEAILSDTGRMVDLWGINCTLLPWEKVN